MFLLSGEELTLPSGEVEALGETYQRDSRFQSLGRRVVASNILDYDTIEKIEQRSAYCRFGGRLLSWSEGLASLAESIDSTLLNDGMTFSVRSSTVPMQEYGDIGGVIKAKTGCKVSLEEPDYLFHVEKGYSGYFLALSRTGYKQFSWKTRRPRARKFFLPSAIYPKLARCLVNLSRAKEGDLFLDPFCGTGSMLIESSMMGMRTVGMDLTKWIARGALLNLKGFSLDYDSIIRADSTKTLPIGEIDAVSTDVPYGRASSTKGKETGEIITGFLGALSDSMISSSRRKKYCVIMHPSHVPLEYDRNSFHLEEQHLLYVHRNLTRAISVLGRL